MNSKRRSEIEISADILKVALDGAKKSHIVYRANLNFEVVKKYLKLLFDSGLISLKTSDKRLFQTTPKGVDYLTQYRALTKYMRYE